MTRGTYRSHINTARTTNHSSTHTLQTTLKMSRSHTVGLLAPNGRLGANILTALLKYHEEGKIGLVILHRPGSPPKTKLPTSVDVREVDLEGDVKTIVPAVKGINVLM